MNEKQYRGMHGGEIRTYSLMESRRSRITHAQRRARIVERSKMLEYGQKMNKH